jgi:hypothetical protein
MNYYNFIHNYCDIDFLNYNFNNIISIINNNGYYIYYNNNNVINNTIINQIKTLLINSGYSYLYNNLESLNFDNTRDRDILSLINKIINSEYNAILETTPNSLGGSDVNIPEFRECFDRCLERSNRGRRGCVNICQNDVNSVFNN